MLGSCLRAMRRAGDDPSAPFGVPDWEKLKIWAGCNTWLSQVRSLGCRMRSEVQREPRPLLSAAEAVSAAAPGAVGLLEVSHSKTAKF